jgi:hypothetical protein
VLDDGRGRLIEFLNQLPGGVEIYEIVVRKFLALQLLSARDSAMARGIKRRGLMRILTLAEIECARRANVEKGRQSRFLFRIYPSQARADGPVISGGEGECFLSQSPQGRLR